VNLPPLPDLEVLRTTRLAWQSVAEHIVSAARFAATGRIGMRATKGGFATPAFEVGGQTRRVGVDGNNLFVETDGQTSSSPLTTLRAAATFVGITAGAPTDVYTPSTPLELDTPLVVDPDAARALASWFGLGSMELETIRAAANAADDPSLVELWPEHFDLGLAFGDELARARGTFGASPGDELHPDPYLYVTHWADVDPNEFWNDTAFDGASITYSELATTGNANATALVFFRRGVAALRKEQTHE